MYTYLYKYLLKIYTMVDNVIAKSWEWGLTPTLD